jgi:lipoprotein NlpI
MATLTKLILVVVSCVAAIPGDDAALKAATAAFEKGDLKKAREQTDEAIKKNPKSANAYVLRGIIKEKQEDFAGAVADQSRALELAPNMTIAYQHRGTAHFNLGKFTESVADFDAYLAKQPTLANQHWQRGISCYYAGKYEAGAKQFKDCEIAYPDDVENAVWHFLCVARMANAEKARAGLLKIEGDRRVPMMEVYALFAGKLKADDVLAAAKKAISDKALNHQLFYAHLYLGLYYEAIGDSARALENLELAVQHPVKHYMFDVARVHRELLKRTNSEAGAKKGLSR